MKVKICLAQNVQKVTSKELKMKKKAANTMDLMCSQD